MRNWRTKNKACLDEAVNERAEQTLDFKKFIDVTKFSWFIIELTFILDKYQEGTWKYSQQLWIDNNYASVVGFWLPHLSVYKWTSRDGKDVNRRTEESSKRNIENREKDILFSPFSKMVLQQSDLPELKNGDKVNCDRIDKKKSTGTACDDDGDLRIGKCNESDAYIQLSADKNAQGNRKKNDKFFVQYRGKNYEISDLLKKHPGGRGTLGSFRGLTLDKVLTDVPHSDAAFHLFEEFVVDNQRGYDDIEVHPNI